MNNRLLFIGEFPPPYGGVTIKDSLLRDEVFGGQGASTFDLYDFKWRKSLFFVHCVNLLKAIIWAERIAVGVGSNSRLSMLLGIIAALKGRSSLENVTIFMMGRDLPEYLSENAKQLWKYRMTRCIFVESCSLIADFERLGISNVRYLPNFRKGDRARAPRPVGDVVHFVYFAQVRPEKGIDTLIAATKMLNAEGLSNKFDVSAYGRIIEGYKDEFDTLIAQVPNLVYKGLLDASTDDVYAELNQYDSSASSSWQEGMSGANIECKFAGIANIVSDAGFNSECVTDGVDGLLVKPRNAASLADAMCRCIEDRNLLTHLKQASFESRIGYDVAEWRSEVLDVVG